MKENSEDDSQQFKSEQLEITETSETSKNATKEINNTINIIEKNVKEEALIVSNKETDGN